MQLAPGILQALLQPSGAALRRGEPPLFLGQALVLDPENDPGPDDGGDLDIHVVVPVRLVLAKKERAADLVTEVHRHPQTALQPGGEHRAVAGPRGIELLRRLLEEDRPTGHQRRRVRELSGGDTLNAGHWRLPGRSEERPLPAGRVEHDHAHRIERDRRPDRLPDGWQDLTEVEGRPQHFRDAAQQVHPVAPAPLPIEQGDDVDEGADHVPHRPKPLDMHVVVGGLEVTRGTQLADHAAARHDRNDDRRPQSRCLDTVPLANEARIRQEVRDVQHVSVEHGRER